MLNSERSIRGALEGERVFAPPAGAMDGQEAMRTVSWDAEGPSVQLIDPQPLPGEVRVLPLQEPAEVVAAIRDMGVCGAPAIGATAAYVLAMAVVISRTTDAELPWEEIETAATALRQSRPTGVNLPRANERVPRAGRAYAPPR